MGLLSCPAGTSGALKKVFSQCKGSVRYPQLGFFLPWRYFRQRLLMSLRCTERSSLSVQDTRKVREAGRIFFRDDRAGYLCTISMVVLYPHWSIHHLPPEFPHKGQVEKYNIHCWMYILLVDCSSFSLTKKIRALSS